MLKVFLIPLLLQYGIVQPLYKKDSVTMDEL